MASVGKRGKSWFVRYRVTDAAGREVMKRVSGFATKEDAWAAAKGLERASTVGIDVHGDAQTAGYWMERWFTEHCAKQVERTTQAKYSEGIDALKSLPVYNQPVRKLSRQALQSTLDQLGQDVKRSPRRCADLTEPLRFALSWAEKQGYIQLNPLRGAKLPAAGKKRQVILNDADIADLAAQSLKTTTSPKKGSVRGGSFGIPIHLALYAGLRREEAAALTWDNVDLIRNTITIVEAHARASSGERIVKDTKSEASRRTISLPRHVTDLLRKAPHLSNYVCVGPAGQPLELTSYAQAVGRCIDAINLERASKKLAPMPRASYHDLRHTHAAYLIRLGLHAKIIQERLGHASIKITMDLYGYLMTGLQESAAAAIDQDYAEKNGHKSGHKDA